MTDKVQKIRKEVVRMHNLLPVMDSDNISVNYADRICTTLEMYIDSMQKEEIPPKLPLISQKKCMFTKDSYTDEDRKILCKDCEEECEYAQKEEPVSEGLKIELEKYIKDHFTIDKEQLDRFGIEEKDYMYSMDKSDMLALVEHFTNWQKTKDQSTIELAEDHAMLAGMEKMKEQMMAKAVDGVVTFDYYNGDKTYGCIAHDSFCLEDRELKDKEEVKLVIIKDKEV